MSTTVAGLHGLMRFYISLLSLLGLWSDITGEISDAHTRTNATNLVYNRPDNPAKRKESRSGQMHDLAHELSEDCLADSLAKHSAKANELTKAVLIGNLLTVDVRPAGRAMLQNKAFLVEWLAHNTAHGPAIIAFAEVGITEHMFMPS